MATFGFHLAITLFILAACMYYIDKKYLKYAPILILFGLIPDIDIFIGIHRATFHNIFIPAIPLMILGIGKALKIEKIQKKQIFFCLAAAVLIVHIALDCSCGGVFIAYPLSNENFDIDVSLVLAREELIASPANFSEISKTPNNITKITNITGPPLPIPILIPKTIYNIDADFESNHLGNTNTRHYISIPSKTYPKVPIISNGIEFIFLITAAIIYVVKFFRPKH